MNLLFEYIAKKQAKPHLCDADKYVGCGILKGKSQF